jgi:hypothetical protein
VSITRYSDKIDGDKGSYHWSVTFDLTSGHLGITQIEGDKVKDRVLLCPKQVKELLAFVESEGRR